MAAEAGKGSNPRPYSVDQKTFDSNWDAIFSTKTQSSDTDAEDTKIADNSQEDQ